VIYTNKDKLNRIEFLPLLLFGVFPALAGLIQSIFYGLLLMWSSIAFSLIIRVLLYKVLLVQNSINEIYERFECSNNSLEHQTSGLQEITSTIEELTSNEALLNEFANEM